MSETTEYLQNCVSEKLKSGYLLISELSSFNHIEGIQKLEKKIKQELSFLHKVKVICIQKYQTLKIIFTIFLQICKTGNIKKEHLQCTNLTHFGALIRSLAEVRSCIGVNKVFNLEDRKIVVDIICDNGLTWMKVIARNPKSLSQICMGDASYGVRSIIDQAQEYIECAPKYPCLFQTPKVHK